MKLLLVFLICIDATGLFIATYLLVFYRRKIESLIDGRDFSFVQLFFGANIYIFHRPFKFDNDYPNRQVLLLSKKYDRLIIIYYLIIAVIIFLTVLLMISGYVPTHGVRSAKA